MTTYQIALAPDLNLDAAVFAAAWNAYPPARAVAEARLAPAESAVLDPTLAGFAVELAGVLAAGVAGNALYDLIKELLLREGVRKRTEIRVLEQPDGTRLIVVTSEEE